MTAEEKALKARYDLLLVIAARFLGKKAADLETELNEDDAADTFDELTTTTLDSARETAFEEGKNKVKGMLGKALKKVGYNEAVPEKFDDTFITGLKKALVPAPKPGDEKPESDKIKDLNAQIATLIQEKETLTAEYTEKEAKMVKDNAKNGLMFNVRQLAERALTDLKANVPADAGTAEKKLARYLKDLDENEYEQDPKTKEYYITDAEGNRVYEGGKAVKLADRINELVTVHYGIRTADSKDNGGLPPDKSKEKPGGFVEYKGEMPKNQDEYIKVMNNPDISAKAKIEMDDAYQLANNPKT